MAAFSYQDDRARRFLQVDVFSDHPGRGNPLAVVLESEDLDDSRMQALASWMNLAETTFLLPPTTADADYRVRIFTPRQEIAFAGHPSIGSAHAAIVAGLATPTEGCLVQECQAGLLPIRVIAEGAGVVLSVRVPRSRIVRYGNSDDILLQRALGGLELGALAPALVEGGRRWWLAELAHSSSVRKMRPDLAAIGELAASSNSLGLCVFAREAGQHARPDGLVVRAFPVGVGIHEDPASGAANAAIAAFLDEAGQLDSLGTRYQVSQGREMGRDARLLLEVDAEREVWVGGACQTVVSGGLRW